MRPKAYLSASGLAGALFLTASTFAFAQNQPYEINNNDPWTHTTEPNANGQCWKMTDTGRGIGYWTNCPQKSEAAATTTTSRRAARHSRIETTGQAPKRER